MSDKTPESAVDWQSLLGENGPLAKIIEGFTPRLQQQQMAEAVGECIANYQTAIIEAGTGVGKTFAYLIPALASEGKVIVSTGTKTLQDQLFLKDLPIVKRALKSDSKLALLKGRANYLCHYRLKQALHDGSFHDKRSANYLHRIDDWASMTASGEVIEVNSVPKESEIWTHVTSTVDNCLGAECEYYNDCFVVKARRRAQEADVVVVNHHLFFADMALKEEGFGELLPNASTVILDESHQIPEIASTFFSDTFSSRQVRELATDIVAETTVIGDMPVLRDTAHKVDKIVQDLRLAMDKPGLREPWYKIRNKPAIIQEVGNLLAEMETLAELLATFAERSQGLETCLERCQVFLVRLRNMQLPQDNAVQWYETFTRSFTLISTPLDIADTFQRQIKALPCAWIFTSATLSVDKSFQHYCQRLGITADRELQLDSPFDYWHHSLLYAPPNIPEPQAHDFVESVVEASLPVIEACQGGTFVLFTSYRALNEAAERFKDELDVPILVQGDAPQHEMIENFRKLGNAVLLGTGSFWEGVDVRGAALSCVIIDKLPFASPFEPVTEARIQSIKDNNGNPFYDFQIPHAVITLKQGVGRLIRDHHDRGVLMICDPRLRTRSYGSIFLESLPRIPRTQKIEVVKRFFALSNAENENETSLDS